MSDYFGSAAQQSVLKSGRALYNVVANDPRYTYYGRAVGLASPADGDLDLLASLASLQGNSNFAAVENTQMPTLKTQAEAMGLTPTHYARWQGADGALSAAHQVLEDRPWPKELRREWLTPKTAHDTLASFAETALRSGVLPPATQALTGSLIKGLTRIAIDGSGTVVSCAASTAFLHPDHPQGETTCWWGMLATHNTRRGESLSLILGAEVLIEMHERFGFTEFFTGVEAGNAPSEAVCTRMGLRNTSQSILSVADPDLLPGGRMTK